MQCENTNSNRHHSNRGSQTSRLPPRQQIVQFKSRADWADGTAPARKRRLRDRCSSCAPRRWRHTWHWDRRQYNCSTRPKCNRELSDRRRSGRTHTNASTWRYTPTSEQARLMSLQQGRAMVQRLDNSTTSDMPLPTRCGTVLGFDVATHPGVRSYGTPARIHTATSVCSGRPSGSGTPVVRQRASAPTTTVMVVVIVVHVLR